METALNIIDLVWDKFLSPVYDKIIPDKYPKRFLNILNPNENDIILEAGAGTGRISKYYGEKVKQLHLVDSSAKMLQQAKNNKKLKNSIFHVGYVENLPYKDNTFDKIVCYFSFHHWQDQPGGLKEIYRILKPNGLVVFVEIDRNSLWGCILQILEWVGQMKSRMFPSKSFIKTLKNFKFIKVEYIQTRSSYIFISICSK